ncbi:hypothetical protein E8E13_010433 [Curvularia kusanoi]|uniref:Uncharacterized protein n=1 Tax=Curvularia kusanoi TaxID=90978 RepID=A0A9P4WD40_CURKU|nr:hypothetical protein E8E13_010433 [Curvularia kusanoi]
MQQLTLPDAASNETSQASRNDVSSALKRKRKVNDDNPDAGRDQINKKRRTAYQNVKSLQQSTSGAFISTNSDTTQEENVAIAAPASKEQHQPAAEALTQLPTPPSSSVTPEREHAIKRDHEVTSEGPDVQDPAEIVVVQGTKRRRYDIADSMEQPKRQRHMNAVKPIKTQQETHAEHLNSHFKGSVRNSKVQEKLSIHKAHAQAVRPESSFAPVQPNHDCELEFLEYLNDSVPVLFSEMIQHSQEETSLNNPPGMLVLDALTAIEKSCKPRSRGAWPSSIELNGRGPGKGSPARVLEDIDLYIHDNDGKLHVATDRGLVAISQYLQIIGVPETQPIWGEEKSVKKDEPLQAHQVACKLENGIATDPNIEDMKVLDAGTGGLPLPLGSTVIVYKVHEDDTWAYGRLSGTSKMGRFPISHTCPMDWSSDKFPCMGKSLAEPSTKPTDPTGLKWDWIETPKFVQGPTSKETLLKSAARAAIEKAKRNKSLKGNADRSIPPLPEVLSNQEKLCVSGTMQTMHTEVARSSDITATRKADKNDGHSKITSSSSNEVQTQDGPVAESTSSSPEPKEPESKKSEPEEPYFEEPSLNQPLSKGPVLESAETNNPAPDRPESEKPELRVQDSTMSANNDAATTTYDTFTKPRYNPFARNDDIEVDWGDSDEEL